MRGIYEIAGHVFEIKTQYDDVHKLCEGYAANRPAEFTIETNRDDIADAKRVTEKEYAKENVPLESVPEGMYESMAVYTKITEILFRHDILLWHGSVVAVDDCAYMFIAKSGTGKSTHTRMWRELLGERAVMVNDDKPLVQITEHGALAYGTPWNGKHHLGNNIAVPLKGICILRRGRENTMRRISPAEAYPMLLQQVHRMPGRENIIKEMELIDKMALRVKLYDMSCNISIEAAEMAYGIMHEGNSAK